ncbi:Phospholipid/glycerol acyltransferase domain-containing protein [Strongyloides ratti]|uniref:Phospholipid/glycerol acyltransferase domain-containing protein n=1 Tax=Strongyloides ratti TaxID=34506 RepID=A0A090LBT1_STRRB|nr:Phospholipid/glycerol acyltransferase domain-containing protein [Strongyloides ratti]CEF67211.1 Phospholipid/glycerol acyltransferase domain-containing protein [Strongyloides ratti]
MLSSFIYFLYLYWIVILWLSGFVIILSSFAFSTGIGEWSVGILCWFFKWASKIHENLENNILEDEFNDQNHNCIDKNGFKRKLSMNSLKIIERNALENLKSKLFEESSEGECTINETGQKIITDSIDFITAGFEVIIDDEVTSRFKAETLVSWNLLSRTKNKYIYVNWRVTLVWVLGWITRYTILLHIRMTIFLFGLCLLIISTALIGFLPSNWFKRWLNVKVMLMCLRIFSRSFGSVIRFHDRHNKPKRSGICVANHTSPIDIMILSCDNCYAMIGQKHYGFLGFLQKTLSRSTDHIWFERSESKDRLAVIKRMQEHVDDYNKLPIIIFPEGSFEIASTIYPIAMKYDAHLGDAFWNSSNEGWIKYLWMMMTSWTIICDVWYLPPMIKGENESAVNFAKRVKKIIANKGGLVDLEWDGQLKRSKVSEKLINEHQKIYFDHLKRKGSFTCFST